MEIRYTKTFSNWLKNLKDRKAALAILKRLTRLEAGNFGDAKSVGGGIFELRFFIGPGYRVYYTIRDNKIIFLLCGGDKSRQAKDIKEARQIAENI